MPPFTEMRAGWQAGAMGGSVTICPNALDGARACDPQQRQNLKARRLYRMLPKAELLRVTDPRSNRRLRLLTSAATKICIVTNSIPERHLKNAGCELDLHR